MTFRPSSPRYPPAAPGRATSRSRGGTCTSRTSARTRWSASRSTPRPAYPDRPATYWRRPALPACCCGMSDLPAATGTTAASEVRVQQVDDPVVVVDDGYDAPLVERGARVRDPELHQLTRRHRSPA